jgi:hypothetical protein
LQQRTNITSTFSEYCTGYCGFGFNGQERDQEIYNNQSTTTATFWEYDGRIGRRWNLDPKPQIFISDYAVMGNNPIINVDPNGDYFFGMFGSTAEQRSAAAKFQKETNGTIINRHKKSIMVCHITKIAVAAGNDNIVVQHDQSFNKDGSLIPENGEIRQYNENSVEKFKKDYLDSPSDNYAKATLKYGGRFAYGVVDGVATFTTNFAFVQDVFGISSIGINGVPNTPDEQFEKGMDGALTIGSFGTSAKFLKQGQYSYSKYADGKNWIKNIDSKIKQLCKEKVNQSVDENIRALSTEKYFGKSLDQVKELYNESKK